MAEPLLPGARRFRVLRVALVVAVLLMLGLLQHFGVLAWFGEPGAVARALRSYGVWGYVLFVVSYTFLQPFGVPGTVFVFAAPLIWPWPIAFALSMIGTMTASVVGFSFARFVARDWLSGTVSARFRRYDQALAKRAFSTVFTLRLIFWMPQLLHTFLGVSKVPFWTHFWASLAGYVLPLLLVSYFGQRVFDVLRHAPPRLWGWLALLLLLTVVVTWLVRRARRPSALAAPAELADGVPKPTEPLREKLGPGA